jgi:putative serine protease PepD
MSSTPQGPQDAAGASQPERSGATEHDAPAPGAAHAAPGQDHPTERIAAAPTEPLPQAGGAAGQPAPAPVPQAGAPAPQQPGPAPYGGPAPDPRPQPRYGRYGHAQGPQQPGQQPAGDPLAAFRAPQHGAPTGGPENATAFGAPGDPATGSTTARRSTRDRLWLPVASVGVGAALLASLGTAALTGAFDDDASAPRATDISSIGGARTDASPVSGSTAENPNWQEVAAAVQSSVVAIQVTTAQGGSQGSGVIVDSDGHIVTNNHVVGGAQGGEVSVTLTDGRIFTAEVVGTDPTTDLAVIRIQDAPDDLAAATLGDSSEVTVGDPVMAVGNPLGLANTVTTGIVSALDRPVSTTESGASEAVVTNAIQIDAAINPGNSGGPLFDAEGRVIGITSSIATTSSQSGSIGLGFAIPVNLADTVAGQLIEDGTAEHAFLGVGLGDGTATADGVTRSGAQVQSVTDGSPAADAGVRQGDVIVAIDGKAVAGAESLTGYVRTYASGDEVTLTLVRDGESQEVDVTLAAREESGAPSQGGTPTDPREMTPEQLWEWFQGQQGGRG